MFRPHVGLGSVFARVFGGDRGTIVYMRIATSLALAVGLGLAGLACDPSELFRSDVDLTAVTPPPANPPVQLDSTARAALQEEASKIGFVPAGDGYVYVDPERRFAANVAADGTIEFVDPPREGVVSDEGLRISGPADWAVRGSEATAGAAKLDLIERSAELRKKLSVQWYEDRVDRQLEGLKSELSAIWKNESVPIGQRRRMLFLRWDECEEDLGHLAAVTAEEAAGSVDDMRAKAGAEARRRIEAFIRAELPSGSPEAYGAQELKELNAERKSTGRFDPYTAVPANTG